MATMSALRQALTDRISGFDDDLTLYWYDPDEIDAPAATIAPDRPFVDYQQAFGSRLAEWKFVITLLADRVDEEAAQQQLDGLLDPSGPFIARLRDDDVGDRLDELCGGNLTVVAGTNYGELARSNSSFLTAQIKVSIRA